MKDEQVTISISTGTILRTILLLSAVGALFVLKHIVLLLLTAIVIASSIEPGVKAMVRHRMPRVLSVLSIYGAIIGTLFVTVFVFIPPILDDLSALLARVPSVIDSIETTTNPLASIPLFENDSGSGATSARQAIADFRTSFSTAPEGFLRTVSAIFGSIVSFILVIVFAFYFSVQEKGIEEFLRLITPVRYEEKVIDLWYRSERKIGLWMQGQLLLAVLIGVFVYLGLAILQVPYALLLGLIAGIFELVPVFGPVFAAIPAVALAFTEGGLTMALVVLAFFIIIQQFENHLLQPLIVTKVVGVPPLLVILSLVIGAQLFGFIGILLAVPVAAVIQELVTDVRKEKASLSKAGKSA